MCTGAFKTTPTAALQVEMGEISLEMRRTQLSVTYWVKLQGHSLDHPTQDILKPCWEKEKKETDSFGWTVKQKAAELKIDHLNITPTVPLPTIQPWIMPDANVELTLLEKKNKDRTFQLSSHNIQDYIDGYHSYVKIYTDASKNRVYKVGVIYCTRVSDQSVAILLATQWVEETKQLRSVICSESSSLLSLFISQQHNH